MGSRQRRHRLERAARLLSFRAARDRGGSPAQRPSDEEIAVIRDTLSRILTDAVIPFWYPATVDLENGGYLANHDLEGRWRGPVDKGIVPQSRILWFFSRLARSPFGTREHLTSAAHGFSFLRDRMWDTTFGGFYWNVSADGERPVQHAKHLYGQAMALYALTEFALVSRDTAAAVLADSLFRLLDDRAHDPRSSGYQEVFRRDWRPPSAGDVNPLGREIAPDMKTTNTHLHLMEAFTAYSRFRAVQTVQLRLLELILLMAGVIADATTGTFHQLFLPGWSLPRAPAARRISYGHDVEAVWMLMDALEAVGLPASLLLELYQSVFAHALRYGFDARRGGFYAAGLPRRRADCRDKVWWVQAEALLGSFRMYALAGDRRYLDCFRGTLQWIERAQVDWRNGDWHAEVHGGEPRGDKAGPWKDPYHQGRALLECLALLDDERPTAAHSSDASGSP